MSKLMDDMLSKIGWQASRLSVLTHTPTARQALFEKHDIKVVFDIGANVGQYAQQLRHYGFKGTIISVEMQGLEHQRLLETAMLDQHWHIAERCALGEKRGIVKYNRFENSLASSILPPSEQHRKNFAHTKVIGQEEAPMMTMLDLFERYESYGAPRFLKIDVQGYEEEVLEGAKACLPYIKGIQAEISYQEMYGKKRQKLGTDMMKLIESYGFTLVHQDRAASPPGGCGEWLQADVIFFKL